MSKSKKRVYRTRYDNLKPILEFANGDLDCMIYRGWPHKSANVCATALRNAMSEARIRGIRVITSKGLVILIKD